MDQTLNDEAITVDNDDLLDRVPFALMLSDIIEKSPANSSLRIGVYGDWGEGKTSVLTLIENRALDRGDKTVWIHPWMHSSSSDVIEALIKTMADAVGVDWLDKAKYWLSTVFSKVSRKTGEVSEIGPRLKAASAILSGPLASLSTRYSKHATERHLRLIFNRLQDNRVIVFIDDLDRTRPSTVPELLMNLRDAFNLPKISFVLALSPEIISRGISAEHPGWEDSSAFLEKMVEWPFFLPPISDEQFRSFIRATTAPAGALRLTDSLEDIAEYLPRNPRRLKTFLRLVGAMDTLLSRFDDDEINLPVFCLCALARMEFPRESWSLLTTEEFSEAALRDSISTATARDGEASEGDSEFLEFPERLREIIKGLGERSRGLSEYQVHETFNFIDRRPILTWKEAYGLFEKCKQYNDEVAVEAIREWIGENEIPVRAEALFSWWIRVRWRLWEIAIDQKQENPTRARLEEMKAATRLLLLLIGRMDVIKRGWIGATAINSLFSFAETYSRWTKPDYYIDTRLEEISLIRSAVEGIPEETGRELLSQMLIVESSRFRTGIGSGSLPEYDQALGEVRSGLRALVCEALVLRFRKPAGIDVLWGDDPNHFAEKNIAFSPESEFHGVKYRRVINELATEARENEVISSNFLTYFQMLAAGATQGGSLEVSNCRELLQDDAFAELIWDAATSSRLNLRMIGSLRSLEDEMIKINVRSGRFPRTHALRDVEANFGFENQ